MNFIWTRNVIGLFLTCNAGGSVCYNRTARAVCWKHYRGKKSQEATGNVSSLEEQEAPASASLCPCGPDDQSLER